MARGEGAAAALASPDIVLAAEGAEESGEEREREREEREATGGDDGSATAMNKSARHSRR
jgi:hypothetical protein